MFANVRSKLSVIFVLQIRMRIQLMPLWRLFHVLMMRNQVYRWVYRKKPLTSAHESWLYIYDSGLKTWYCTRMFRFLSLFSYFSAIVICWYMSFSNWYWQLISPSYMWSCLAYRKIKIILNTENVYITEVNAWKCEIRHTLNIFFWSCIILLSCP